jgi:hypothetical protein
MTTGYDVGALVPENICGTCGQPAPMHLSMCISVDPPRPTASPPVTPATVEAVDDMEHKLGEAI